MSEWTLTDRGRSFLVSDSGAGAVLATADGRPVLEEVGGPLGMLKAELGQVQGVRQQLRIELGFGRSVRQVVLVEHSAGKPAVTRLVPPMGSRARRLYDLRESHAHLYAARHVAATVVGFLGISAIIGAFLARLWSRIDWSWLPELPQFTLPDITPPEWLRYLDPFYWFRELLAWIGSLMPDWNLAWLPDVGLPWLRYLVPLGIAVAVASREVQRRQVRERREAGYRAVEGRVESAAEGRTAEPGAETSEQVESSTPPRVAGSRSGPTRAEPAGDVDDADR